MFSISLCIPSATSCKACNALSETRKRSINISFPWRKKGRNQNLNPKRKSRGHARRNFRLTISGNKKNRKVLLPAAMASQFTYLQYPRRYRETVPRDRIGEVNPNPTKQTALPGFISVFYDESSKAQINPREWYKKGGPIWLMWVVLERKAQLIGLKLKKQQKGHVSCKFPSFFFDKLH